MKDGTGQRVVIFIYSGATLSSHDSIEMGFDGVSPYRGDDVDPNDWNRGSGLNSYVSPSRRRLARGTEHRILRIKAVPSPWGRRSG
jgi:hypothetical protein